MDRWFVQREPKPSDPQKGTIIRLPSGKLHLMKNFMLDGSAVAQPLGSEDEQGPFTWRELRELALSGKLSPMDQIHVEETRAAKPARSLEDLFPEWYFLKVFS